MKAFLADDMLNPASIFNRCFLIHAERHQPFGKKCVPFVYFVRDGLPFFSEANESLRIHLDISIFAQIFHLNADAGLGKFQLVYDVDRADLPLALL